MSSSTKEYFWTCCLGATRRLRGGGKSPAEVVRHVSDDVLRSLIPDCKHVGAGRADTSEHRRADGADLATPTSHVVPRFPPSRLEQGEGVVHEVISSSTASGIALSVPPLRRKQPHVLVRKSRSGHTLPIAPISIRSVGVKNNHVWKLSQHRIAVKGVMDVGNTG
ncbi:uncharacterized protein BDZ83DRAFT_652347 [Colletotrichum acutatum]|uniref:Uncharacterized protein n=1 Tax=Glomerella acutata TaxID=27357 RepID=A0AAD8UHY8_GLOAC|nr:uncharacterized protein BDZ83DRAFT_652347 [Colletotrichum acutatum]KAK1724266.1 hypothetical protein BDZ83DRAFT_652347 [Colletotrichum acutatum]